jgi:hypothetical protein
MCNIFLFYCFIYNLTVVITSGADSVLGRTANREFKQRVLFAAAKFLEDGDTETRHNAQELVNRLEKVEDFERFMCMVQKRFQNVENILREAQYYSEFQDSGVHCIHQYEFLVELGTRGTAVERTPEKKNCRVRSPKE